MDALNPSTTSSLSFNTQAPLARTAIEIVRDRDGRLRRLLCKPNQLLWLPSEPQPTIARLERSGIEFPAELPDFAPTCRELLAAIATQLAESGMVQPTTKAARLAAMFALFTWRPDRLPSFPTLLLVSKSRERRRHALRCLRLLVRRALLLPFETMQGLKRLDWRLHPTVLLETDKPSKQLLRCLEDNSTEMATFAGGKNLDMSGCRIIAVAERLTVENAITIELASKPEVSINEDSLRRLRAGLLGYGMRRPQSPSLPRTVGYEQTGLLAMLESCFEEDPQLCSELASDCKPDRRASLREEVQRMVSEVLVYKTLKYGFKRPEHWPATDDPEVLIEADLAFMLALPSRANAFGNFGDADSVETARTVPESQGSLIEDEAKFVEKHGKYVGADFARSLFTRLQEAKAKGGSQ